MSNFAFLKSEWLAAQEAATKTKAPAPVDARTICFYARRQLELAASSTPIAAPTAHAAI